MRNQATILLSFLLVLGAVAAQERRGRKPVLIRADEEKKEEEVVLYDPAQAKRSVSIGDFYFKRGNYKAAGERYREAILYNTEWEEPYEKLIESLEKQGDLPGAIEACGLFARYNPESEKSADFVKRASELESQAAGGS